MVGSALNLEYKSHGGVCATRKLHKLLRTADRIFSVPRRGRQLYICVDTQLCVSSKAIERKIHQIRKAEDKVRQAPPGGTHTTTDLYSKLSADPTIFAKLRIKSEKADA